MLYANIVIFELAGFLLDYLALGLILVFGTYLVITGRKKDNEIGRQYNIGIGYFFISVAISSIIYVMDLTYRTFFNRGGDGEIRLIPKHDFASVHQESYFIVILTALLIAIHFLMKPIEKYMLKRADPKVSRICAFIVPLPTITLILELITLPEENSVEFYIFTAMFAVVWLAIAVSILTMLSLYFKLSMKGTGDVRKRSSAIVFALIIWLATVFLRSTFLKEINDTPYIFWLLPTIEILMLSFFVYGFGQNLQYDFNQEKEKYMYNHWFFKTLMVAIFIYFAVFLTLYFWNSGLDIVTYWAGERKIQQAIIRQGGEPSFIYKFGEFMDRSFDFDGEGLGAGDISYILLGIAFLLYMGSFIGPMKDKLKNSRKYTGLFLAGGIVLAVVNRIFKTFFARARPGDAIGDNSLYSRMFEMGKYSLDDGFSTGSFTSGHTTTAAILIILAFMLIKTHKTWIITIGFTVTIAWAALMGYGRVVEGSHYPGDTVWAILIAILLICWVYFYVFRIPEQEEGTLEITGKFTEIKWGIMFIFFAVSVCVILLGIKYSIMEFEWYWPVAAVAGVPLAYLFYKLMNQVLEKNSQQGKPKKEEPSPSVVEKPAEPILVVEKEEKVVIDEEVLAKTGELDKSISDWENKVKSDLGPQDN
jgi:membrane-associated phospholipid phosphatase